MYANCLFCQKELGTNESIEAFPIGRRLAFDAAKGRLWVVCKKCERWNLTPLEERWEAIEQAERLYRDTRRRVSTEEIGLARLADGTELVRIGEPLRPEFAAWRYGDQFGRRRRRQFLIAGAGVTALSALVVGGAVAAGSIGGFGFLIARSGRAILRGDPESIVARVKTDTAGPIAIRRRHLGESAISSSSNGQLALDLRFVKGRARFEGKEALRIASTVIPAVNRYGGSKETVAKAVDTIERAGGTEGFLDRLTSANASRPSEYLGIRRLRRSTDMYSSGLYALTPVDRLALEMALHEESERRAMMGELTELEAAWKSAEEIAAIADDMFVPESVRARLDQK